MTDYEKEAKKALKDFDFQRAGDLYVLAAKQDKALDCYLKGKHYDSAGRLLERMEDFGQAARYYKMGFRLNEAAEMLLKLGDKNQALGLFEKAENWTKAKDLAISTGEPHKAAFYAEKAGQIEQAASLYAKAANYNQAVALYEKIVQGMLKEQDEKGYFQSWIAKLQKYAHNTAVLLEMMQQPGKAAFYYTLSENWKAAAHAYLRAGQLDKAVENFAKAKEFPAAMKIIAENPGLEPTNPLDFAESCYSTGNYKEAAKYFIKSNDKYRAAESLDKAKEYEAAGNLYLEAMDPEKATELYLRGELWEKAAPLLEMLKNFGYAAQLYLKLNKKEDAVRALASGNEFYQAALLLLEIGNKDEAMAYLQRVTIDHQDYEKTCLLLAQEFMKLNMPSIAIKKITEGLEGQPLGKNNIEFYYMLAQAHEQQLNTTESLNIYEKILALDLNFKDVKDKVAAIKNGVKQEGQENITTRFKIMEHLSTDKTISVYKALDTKSNRPLIIKKILTAELGSGKQYLDATSNLTHKNIAHIYETLQDEQYTYICMEYFEGDPLRKVLENGFSDFSTVKDIAEQMCHALLVAHAKNIIHKNLCPENIYITKDNMVKILNFDTPIYLIPNISSDYLINYKAPEQMEGYALDARADIYSFGVVLYEMIYNKYPSLPIDKENYDQYFPITKWNSPIPEFFKSIIIKCLMEDRKFRYNKIDEILEDLSLEEISPGMTLGGRYEILQELGSGGMGKIYKAKDRDLEEIVALKILKSDYAQDPAAQNRFKREIKLSRKISHPNVVKVYDIGFFKGHRYISMEYIDGLSLDKFIEQKSFLPLLQALKIALQICSATAAAHALGIIHRDLKPANIMLKKDDSIKILDFGIAKAVGGGEITTAGQIIGSPKYMAPEQIQESEVDARTDIYLIGLIIYTMLTGKEPFSGTDAKSVLMKQLYEAPALPSFMNPSIPPFMDELILAMLKKNREERPESVGYIHTKIKGLIDIISKTQ